MGRKKKTRKKTCRTSLAGDYWLIFQGGIDTTITELYLTWSLNKLVPFITRRISRIHAATLYKYNSTASSSRTVVRVPPRANENILQQLNIPQEPLEPWSSSDPRTHEHSPPNWGAGVPQTGSVISLAGKHHIHNGYRSWRATNRLSHLISRSAPHSQWIQELACQKQAQSSH
jgi:hypothetical protein